MSFQFVQWNLNGVDARLIGDIPVRRLKLGEGKRVKRGSDDSFQSSFAGSDLLSSRLAYLEADVCDDFDAADVRS